MRTFLYVLLGVVLVIAGLWLLFGPGYGICFLPYYGAGSTPILYGCISLSHFGLQTIAVAVAMMLLGIFFLSECKGVNQRNVWIAVFDLFLVAVSAAILYLLYLLAHLIVVAMGYLLLPTLAFILLLVAEYVSHAPRKP